MSLNLRIAKLGSAIDSATTGHFLSKGATDAVFQAISSGGLDSASVTNLIDSAYVQARQTDIYRDSAFVTGIVDSAYVQARQTSSGSGGLDSAATISLINNNTNSGFYKYKYTATAGQTVFADSDANGNVMSFDPNSTLVFYNGVLLDETTDYEASSNTVTLTSGADAGVSITVAKYGVGYVAPTIAWGGDRGLVGGGSNNSDDVTIGNKINYMDITTLGNASVFGTLTAGRRNNAAFGNGTYALFAGGKSGSNYEVNIIDYVTVATTGNASDVGDLNRGAYEMGTGLSDGTYGVIAGGRLGPANYTIINDIQYLTISTSGNASDFGDMSVATRRPSQVSHSTRGIIAGGEQVSTGATTTIEYITIASPGNATDFGDLTGTNYGMAPMGDGTYGVLAGGERSGYIASIDYVTIDTPANATDFGDLSTAKWNAAGCNNATRGLVMGGENGSATIIQYLDITTPGNAASFGSLANEHTLGSGASGNPS